MTQAAPGRAIFDVAPRPVPDWMGKRYAAALDVFRAQGLPSRRVEDWKYTDLRARVDAAEDAGGERLTWSVQNGNVGIELFDLEDLAAAPSWVRDHLGKSAADSARP